MNSAKQYLGKVIRGVFNRGETFAVEGGIAFGPARDPKGSFYSHPKLAIYWYQPDSAVVTDEQGRASGLLKGLITKLGTLRLSA